MAEHLVGFARLLSIREVAQRLGISEISAYRWCESGKINSIRLGGRRLVAESVVLGIIDTAASTPLEGDPKK
jgi:excisionase family DNA binding protein